MKCHLFSLIVLSLFACVLPTARAELTPEQVVIIAMAKSKESVELANYYAKARGIPESHIYLLDSEVTQRITRYRWDKTIRPALLDWLKKQDFFENTRCLVTLWDVPLRIEPFDSRSPELEQRLTHLQKCRGDLVAHADKLFRYIRSGGKPSEPSETDPALAADIPLAKLKSQLDEQLKMLDAWQRSARTADDRQKARQFIERILLTTQGSQGLLELARPRSAATRLTTEQASQIALLTGQIQGLQRGLQALVSMHETVARDEEAIEINQAIGGLIGAIGWIDQQIYLLKQNFTGASFDSELSLLLWPDPPVLSWVSNPWFYSHDSNPGHRQDTLMVSRLSGTNPEVVRRMIDNAIAVEKTSLQGTVYLDARGLPYVSGGGNSNNVYSQCDQSLRDLAERLQKHTKMKVVLDNQKELFQKGSCPEAALYCGWHSPQRYLDAFEWSPGAVGYHLADSEAEWLQINDDNRLTGKYPWCPMMLAEGACATVGACGESYIVAFPLPDDFFSILLTGKYTLVETYYRSCPYISWMVTLIGDPLYNPYKNGPKLSAKDLPDQMKPGGGRAAKKAAAEQVKSPPASIDATQHGLETKKPEDKAPPEETELVLPGRVSD